MSTRTTYYNLTKPDADEHVLRTVINQNYDAIDLQMHANAQAAEEAAHISADEYDENASYVKGDFCINQNTLYKANKNTSGPFTAADWDATTIADAFEPKHTWSLLETITADGTSNYYEADIPENASGIYVVLAEAAGQTQNEGSVAVTVNFETDSASTFRQMSYFGNMITNGERYAICEIEIDGNRCKPTYSSVATTANATTNVYWRNEYTYFNKGKIKKLRVVTSSSTIYHPSGSTFEIYIRQ